MSGIIKWRHQTRDILNYVHHKSVKYVPFEMYNLFARIAYYCDIKYETLRDKISIIHYARINHGTERLLIIIWKSYGGTMRSLRHFI